MKKKEEKVIKQSEFGIGWGAACFFCGIIISLAIGFVALNDYSIKLTSFCNSLNYEESHMFSDSWKVGGFECVTTKVQNGLNYEIHSYYSNIDNPSYLGGSEYVVQK